MNDNKKQEYPCRQNIRIINAKLKDKSDLNLREESGSLASVHHYQKLLESIIKTYMKQHMGPSKKKKELINKMEKIFTSNPIFFFWGSRKQSQQTGRKMAKTGCNSSLHNHDSLLRNLKLKYSKRNAKGNKPTLFFHLFHGIS